MSEDDEGGIAPPTEQRGRLFHPGYAYALGAVLVLVFYVLRFVLHIEYVLDPEARMVPTVGREWAHGHHLREFAYYHYNPYQGSCLLDAFLSMLGYRVLGDHILSWQWVPFAYVAATTVAGMALLLRAGGAFAAFSFPLLLAGAPFLLKDGLLSIIGGHGSGPAFALAALALALGCGERRKGVDLRALFAGLCLGLGAWYMRTSAIAGPAVLLAVLARGGWKSLIPFALGLLSFPGLILWNAEALLAAGAPAAAGGKEALLQHMLWDVREIRQGGMPTAEKLRQAFGLSFERLLFAQPDALRTVEFAVRPGVPLRRAWTLAWQLSPPMVLALGAWHTLLPKRLPLREAWVGPLAVLLVITGYVGAYVASPFQVEDEVLNLTQGLMHGPGVNGTRYLVPIYLALTLGWALALGLVWELGRGRPWLGLLPKAAALALLGVTAGVGLNFAAIDIDEHWNERYDFNSEQAYLYEGMFGPHRGPPVTTHLRCRPEDPISRREHLISAGWFLAPEARTLSHNVQAVVMVLQWAENHFALSEPDRAVLAEGLGVAVGDALASDAGADQTELFAGLHQAAAPLSGLEARGFLRGVQGAFDPSNLRLGPGQVANALCAEIKWGVSPLCLRAGSILADQGRDALPAQPMALFPPEVRAAVAGWSTHQRAALIAGAAGELRLQGARFSPTVPALQAWPKDLKKAYEDGYRGRGSRLVLNF